MSGENRVDVGEVTQSSVKGKAMESALASVQNSQGIQRMPKKSNKK